MNSRATAATKNTPEKVVLIFLPRSDVSIVMDNDSYFPFKHDEMPGNDGYHTADKENTPPEVKFKTKKFPEKLLV